MSLLSEKDKIIDTLLRQIHNPANQTPLSFAPAKLSPRGPAEGAAAPGANGNVPTASNSNVKDIQAWLASSQNSAYRSPYRSDGRPFFDEDESTDDEDVDRDNLSDSAMDSVSQSGLHKHVKDETIDRLEVASAASSTGRARTHGRRPSNSEPKLHSLPVAFFYQNVATSPKSPFYLPQNENTPLGFLADLSLTSQTEKEKQEERDKQHRRFSSLSNSSLGSGASRNGANGETKGGNLAVSSNAISPITPDGGHDDAVGPANKNYWKPGSKYFSRIPVWVLTCHMSQALLLIPT